MDILKLIAFSFKSYANGVLAFALNPVAWIFIFIIIGQYKKFSILQQSMYRGKNKQDTKELVTTSILFGIIAGLVGTIIMTTLGVTFYKTNGLNYIIFLSILFMLINPRYVCLSYSGGILSLFVLILSFLYEKGIIVQGSMLSSIYDAMNFDIPALMAIIAIMHFMESLLMWIDGKRGAVPVFMRQDDEVVGAFVMQRFWIIPIILFFFVSQKPTDLSNLLTTPDWWPLIKSKELGDLAKDALFMATPLIAMLGYSDFTLTTTVESKVKRASLGLAAFSLILLLLSFLATKFYVFNFIAALFAPLAHEGLIILERWRENKGNPIFKKKDDGIVVLDTIPMSAAEAMGIKPGDTIISINNKRVKEIADTEEIFNEFPNFLWVEIKDIDGKVKILEYKDYKEAIKEMGIITVPDNLFDIPIVQEKRKSFFDRIRRRSR